MPHDLTFERIEIGQEVPPLRQHVEAATLVRYAGASEDYAHQHWDHLYMVERGFSGVIVHGWLTFAYMCRAVTDWIPREVADVADFSVRYHRPNYLGEIVCSGRVVGKSEQDGVRKVELDLAATTEADELTTTARMTLTFPNIAAKSVAGA